MSSIPARRPLAVLTLAACWLPLAGLAARGVAGWDTGLALCTDYTGPGAVSAFARQAPWGVTPDVATLGTDPVARWHDGLVYVVNRSGGNNVQILDPADGWRTVRQFSVGAGRNPQDIAFAPDGAVYVSCYDEAVLLRVDTVAGVVLDTYSTAAFADADGLPETGWMEATGGRLFVTAQRLDRNNLYLPAGPATLLVFDLVARAWVDAAPATPAIDPIALVGADPYGQPELAPGGGRLRLPCLGVYGQTDGGVEDVDLVALRSDGYLVTEQTMGGDVLDFTIVDGGLAWAIVGDVATFATAVKAWNPGTGQIGVTARASSVYAYPDLAYDGRGWLYLADRTSAAAGLRVFDARTGAEQTAAPLPTGLPPAWIVLPSRPLLTAVPAAPSAPSAVTLAAPTPNPANPGCDLRLRGPADATIPVALHDLRGRRVRAVLVQLDAAGEGRFRFDGRDDAGRDVAAGRYLVRAGGAAVGLTIVR